MFGGCGNTHSIQVGTTQITQPNTPLTPQATQVQNYGDSITCAYIAQPVLDQTPNSLGTFVVSKYGYAPLLNAYLGETWINLCRPGDQAADMARDWLYLNAVPAAGASQLYTVMIGTNDADFCGGTQGCLSNWALSLRASLAWLGLPAADKVLGKDAALGTDWVEDLGFGAATTKPNDTITFTVNQAVANRSLFVAYRVFDAGTLTPGSATLSVDGTVVDTLNTQVNTGHPILTAHNVSDTVFLETVPLGAVGMHTVQLKTSATGGFFSVMWAGASTQNYATVPGSPRILIAQIINSIDPTVDANITTYDAQLPQILSSFTAEGLYITTAPTHNLLNPSTDYADTIHPNGQGHAKLAAVFESVL
jgi:lysophospholipase L1-like esterase